MRQLSNLTSRLSSSGKNILITGIDQGNYVDLRGRLLSFCGFDGVDLSKFKTFIDGDIIIDQPLLSAAMNADRQLANPKRGSVVVGYCDNLPNIVHFFDEVIFVMTPLASFKREHLSRIKETEAKHYVLPPFLTNDELAAHKAVWTRYSNLTRLGYSNLYARTYEHLSKEFARLQRIDANLRFVEANF